MGKKIVLINILVILLIGNIFVSAVRINLPVNHFALLTENSNGNDADLPVWKNGDFWTYDITIRGNDNSGDISFDISFSNLKFTVISDTDNVYKISINGVFSGTGSYGDTLSGQIRDGKITGVEYIYKSNLSIKNLKNIHLTGKITVLDFDVDIDTVDFSPSYAPLVFPMNVGDSWKVRTTVMKLKGYINRPSLISGELDLELQVGGYTAKCEKKENKEGYQAIKIKQNNTNSWYAPDAGNVVYAKNFGNIKLFMWGLPDYYYDVTFFEMKLKDTNYEPPNDPPSAPNRPSGETNGRAGVEYTYCVSEGYDPNDDQVKYGFDWNGDGTVDDWTDLVNSGEKACKAHVFTSEGIYKIKAKTMDSRGAKSGWSPELIVHIAPNNPPSTPDKPSGPTQGIVGSEYTYTTNEVTDPDNDDVTYEFEWGDGETTTGLDTPSASHIWKTKGNFVVKVRARDSCGAVSAWSDGLQVSMDNNPPVTPTAPEGPRSGRKNTELSYTAYTTDPEGHKIYYKFDWGDGTTSDWLGPKNSGDKIVATHTWENKGDYEIRVKAKDKYGELSDWSEPLPIKIPLQKVVNPIILQLLNRLKESILILRLEEIFP